MYELAKDIIIPAASIILTVAVAYVTTIYTFRRESNNGRLRMLELVRRYFLNVLNAFDHESKQLKKDALTKNMYIEEQKVIVKELSELIAHPYFSVLIKRYPLLSKLVMQARRELIGNEMQSSLVIDMGTVAEFWRLYAIIAKELPKLVKSEIDDTIISLAGVMGLQSNE